MRTRDLGGNLIGPDRAMVIRVASLYEDGVDEDTLASLSGLAPADVSTELGELVASGIIQWVGDRVRVNRRSLGWEGLVGILDTEGRILAQLSRLAEELAGYGARAAIYGGRDRISGAFTDTVIVEPSLPSAQGNRVSLVDELQALLNGSEGASFESIEAAGVPRFSSATPTEEVRVWLHAEDHEVRLAPEAILIGRSRAIKIATDPGTRNVTTQTIPPRDEG